MSSFISLRSDAKSLRIGNPTFKLLMKRMNERKDSSPVIARIVEQNPIAECVGRLVFDDLTVEDINAFFELAEGVLKETEASPLSEGGFNRHEDLVGLVEALNQRIPHIK